MLLVLVITVTRIIGVLVALVLHVLSNPFRVVSVVGRHPGPGSSEPAESGDTSCGVRTPRQLEGLSPALGP